MRDVEEDGLRPHGALDLREAARAGFEVRELTVLVRGLCAGCARAG